MQKTFIGPRLRRLRQERGETQSAMARALGISPAYVNLLESNQRSVSVQVLLRLFEAYGVDWRDIAEDEGSTLLPDLRAVAQDPIFDGARPDLSRAARGAGALPDAGGGLRAAAPELPDRHRPAARDLRGRGRRGARAGREPARGGGAQLLPPQPQPLPRARGRGGGVLARRRAGDRRDLLLHEAAAEGGPRGDRAGGAGARPAADAAPLRRARRRDPARARRSTIPTGCSSSCTCTGC